jgi:cyclopropane fatty-acyl-phospholipid synthase-like methyltransferase
MDPPTVESAVLAPRGAAAHGRGQRDGVTVIRGAGIDSMIHELGKSAREGASNAAAAARESARENLPAVVEMNPKSAILLSDRVVFNDERLARKYASESIPISTLYDAYFEGAIDIPGDLVSFLRNRNGFVKHTITRQHLQWAVTNFVPEMVAHSREADARAARELFDERGSDFFHAFLGDRMSFSCAHFEFPTDSLETACEQASSRICDKIGLRASHRVLDVGAGWGAFLSHVAASRGAEGLGVTLSRSQEAHANRRFAELGVEHQARVLLADYRDLPAEKFDRIVCIEAVERVGVKNLKTFFEKLAEHLEDDGLLFLQWTGLRRQLRPEDLMWGLFINKHILPGADAGLPLSSMLKVAEKAGWEVRGVENVGLQYAQTLRLWLANWEARRERIVAQHGERWFRTWQFFLAWSQLVAEQGSAACFQVVLNKNLDTLDRRGL